MKRFRWIIAIVVGLLVLMSGSAIHASDAKLHYKTITPMQTAAAIAYYGQHKVKKDIGRGIFSETTNLNIYQNDNADGLNVKGRGNSWYLRHSNSNGGHNAAYTVGADGTVAFYMVSTLNQKKNKDPYATANLRDIIQYVNDQGAANQVRSKAQHIHLKNSVSSSQTQQGNLSYEELALAAFIEQCRGDSLDAKMHTMDQMIDGKTAYPNQEQPAIMQRKEDSTIEIGLGRFVESWALVDFEGNKVNVNSYTHSQKTSSHTYTRQELVAEWANHKQELDNDIQRINANQQKYDVTIDDN